MWKRAYLGLGSNVGDRERMLQAALDAMAAPDLSVLRVSPVYETEPMMVRDQPWFLNAIAEVDTRLFPLMLLSRVQRIERDLGRRRVVPKGPRSIDIDVLLYGAFVVDLPELKIPHPGIPGRRFVLRPLCDLAPELRHPVTRRTMREMLDASPAAVIRPTPFTLLANAAQK